MNVVKDEGPHPAFLEASPYRARASRGHPLPGGEGSHEYNAAILKTLPAIVLVLHVGRGQAAAFEAEVRCGSRRCTRMPQQ